MTMDGRWVVSGNERGDLRLWDLETGQCLHVMHGNNFSVDAVSVTPDGRRAVSGNADKNLRVWDLETGRCLRTLEGHTSWVKSISVTPDSKRAVSGSHDHTLRVWDLGTGRCLKVMKGHTNSVIGVSITPDKRHAVSWSYLSKKLRVWNLETGRCLHILEGHVGKVNAVSLTPDGLRAFSGSEDNTLRIWDLETGRCLAVYPSRNAGIRCLAQQAGCIVVGTATGKVEFLRLHNPLAAPPFLTAVRLRRFDSQVPPSQWDENIKATCQWCGQCFPVSENILNLIRTMPRKPDNILDFIRNIAHKIGLAPSQSPYENLPAAAWGEPGLLSECPHCNKPLKFNPFVVDNRECY